VTLPTFDDDLLALLRRHPEISVCVLLTAEGMDLHIRSGGLTARHAAAAACLKDAVSSFLNVPGVREAINDAMIRASNAVVSEAN
jgi:hypothetical protein